MRSTNTVPEPRSSIPSGLGGMQTSEQDREITKEYPRRIEAVLDLIWLVGAIIRAAFARSPASRTRVWNWLNRRKRVAGGSPSAISTACRPVPGRCLNER